MSAEEIDLLHRHLNGDLDAAGQAAFFERVRTSDELRRALAARALDEVLVSELVLERRSAPRRSYGLVAAAAAAFMLAGLWFLLRGDPSPALVKTAEQPAPVDLAVRRAAAFLESRHRDLWAPLADGHRHGSAPRRTYAELALLAFHRAGYAADHPVVADLVGRVTTRPIESTYIAALQAMALAEIDPTAHQGRIRECARLLTQAQARNGQWDYGVSPAPPSGDNSVSGYAALGLRACAKAGVAVEGDVLVRARRWWVQAQNPDGGWGYNDIVNAPARGDVSKATSDTSYGSASASALAALAAIVDLIGPDAASEEAIRKGTAWMGANFEAYRNPLKAAGFCHAHWYLTCARAGRGLGVERFGDHDWYAGISARLLASQRDDGSWTLEQGDFMGRERNDLLDTCLAILTLKR